MLYLSQLLGRTIYADNKPFGKIIDMAIFENRPYPPISKIEVKKGKKKLTISPNALKFINNRLVLINKHTPLLPYDHQDFYLAEDLLDKQVIDTQGKRLVRVNDVLIDNRDLLNVAGIDVGFPGILRRLGLTNLQMESRIIPWQFFEAFDYETGTVQIKLTESKLNSLHPSELADILEDAGAKERMGIMAALDAKRAAAAIEETDLETQEAILEELPVKNFKEMLNKIRVSKLVDMLEGLHVDKSKEIEGALHEDKAASVKKLLSFSGDVAGGLMHPHFLSIDGEKTVKEILHMLSSVELIPDALVVTNGNGKLVGTIKSKNLFHFDQLALVKDLVEDKQFVLEDTSLLQISRVFSHYNLRVLPVVNKEKQPIGVVLIDDILHIMQQDQEYDSL